jgi:redox-sensing transcriptional repressor
MHNKNCIIRISKYRNVLRNLKLLNFSKVFSDNLADAAGETAVQVRKDFSVLAIPGNRRGGYPVDDLIEQLDKIFGKDKPQKFIVVGVGNIGRALLNYSGFARNGITITAGFDNDPAKIAQTAEIPVLPIDQVKEFVASNGIRFAIICVPSLAAPQIVEILISAGIKGILNFAPINIKERPACLIENINLVTELEHIIYFVNALEKTGSA